MTTKFDVGTKVKLTRQVTLTLETPYGKTRMLLPQGTIGTVKGVYMKHKKVEKIVYATTKRDVTVFFDKSEFTIPLSIVVLEEDIVW